MNIASLCILTLFGVFVAGRAQAQANARHVVVISIDGLRPAEYTGTGACGGEIPNLRKLMGSGVYSRGVVGVLPTVTYPSHATLVTGAYPATHGVVNNVRSRDGAEWHYDRSDIKVPTLWDAARAAGRSVAIVTWPSSYGANANYLIPEDLSAVDTVASRIRAGSTPGLFDSLEMMTGRIKLLSFADKEAGIPLDRMTFEFSSEVVRRYRPDLLFLHFLDLDHREHFEGVGSVGACRALGRIDRYVGGMRAAYLAAGLLKNTTFFIVSDHGFFPLHSLLNVREALAQAGWDSVVNDSMENLIEVRSAGGSAAVYYRNGVDSALGNKVETRLRPSFESRFRGLIRWVSEPEARLGGFPGAAFVLCAAPGYALSASDVQPRKLVAPTGSFVGTHGYCPDEPGIEASFVAGGEAIRPLGEIPRIRMIDIAPTIAAVLGITLPGADGISLAGIIQKKK